MKRNLFNLVLAVGMAALMFSVSGCSDYDNGFTEKDIEFGKDFESIFGLADPKQDWSMANVVKVNTAVSGSYLEIYSGAPAIATSKLLLSTKLGGSALAFNVVDGTEQVYAIVRDAQGKAVVQGYYDLKDNAVSINDKPVKKKEAKALATRAASNVTKGDVVSPGLSVDDLESSEELFKFNNQGPYTYDELVELVKARKDDKGNPNYYYTNPFTNCVVKDNNNTPVGWDFTNAVLDRSQVQVVSAKFSIKLTNLNGVEKWPVDPWVLSVGKELFGYGGYFKESQAYFSNEKLSHYGATPQEQLETMKKIEAGFSITTTGGEINLPYIYGATGIYDQFGYVYYKEGEDPIKQPHYILMENAMPQENIYFNGWQSAGTRIFNMLLSGWTGRDDIVITNRYSGEGWPADTKVYGTMYKLAFFGENHDQMATYDFPAGYRIVFFIISTNDINGQDNKGEYQPFSFNYSLPELNARLGHLYGNAGSLTHQNGVNPEGAVKAVAWETGGITALGFEDAGGDMDLNDIVLWIEGEFEADQELVKVETTTSNESESWIFACEDLGGSYDYDFNDVVWEVYKEYKATTTTTTENGVSSSATTKEFVAGKVRLLAAGGTLPVELYYNEKCLGNVHQLFGQQPVGNNLYHQVNVGAQVTTPSVELVIPDLTITATTNINDIKNNFRVKVVGDNGTSHFVTAPNMSSTAPQIILLPGEWEWPRENVAITDAYPEFTDWVQDKSWTDWARTWVTTNTVNRPKGRSTNVSGGEDNGNTGNEGSGDNAGSDDTNNNEGGNAGSDNLQDPGLNINSSVNLNANQQQQTENITTNSDGTLTVTSSNGSVVAVSLNGKQMQLTALKAGTAIITVQQAATSAFAASEKTMQVTVQASDANLQINGSINMDMSQGQQNLQFSTNNGNGAVTAVSNNESVVTVTVNGNNVVFTPQAAGSATVTVTQAASGLYNSATKTVNVTVTDNNNNSGGGNAGSDNLQDPGLNVNNSSVELGFYNRSTSVGFRTSSDGEITATSSDESVVTVTLNGQQMTLTALKAGTATITVRQAATSTYAAAEKTIQVTVQASDANLQINQTLSLSVNYNKTQSPTIQTSSDGEITATNSDESVVAVTLNGKQLTFTALKAGTATITIKQAASAFHRAAETAVVVTVTEY